MMMSLHVLPATSGMCVMIQILHVQVLREKMVHFLSETARYIGSIGELSPELIQLRYCLCVVARHCASQLADALPKAFGADTRRTFFDMMSMFCEEGAPGRACILSTFCKGSRLVAQ